MADIFLSYGHTDRARAEALVELLSAHFSVWWDKDLDAACTWRKELEEQIDAARCVVVLWTKPPGTGLRALGGQPCGPAPDPAAGEPGWRGCAAGFHRIPVDQPEGLER
jgi:hypothetical protein